jgi:hypothetical protein
MSHHWRQIFRCVLGTPRAAQIAKQQYLSEPDPVASEVALAGTLTAGQGVVTIARC